MPQTQLLFYCEVDGKVPVRDWLLELRDKNRKAFANCVARIERLAELGHELRRPEADILSDGIYELRAKQGKVNYRILYFYHGKNIAILTHALTKEDKIPKNDLTRALQRKAAFEADPEQHTFEEDISNG